MKKYLAALAVVVTVVGTLACGMGGGDSRGPGVQRDGGGTKEKTIIYEVGGTATKANNITYSLGGNTSQDNGTGLPWKKEAKTTDSIVIVGLSAQNEDKSGEITCKVTVDGEVVAENKSSGQYAIVSCNGSK